MKRARGLGALICVLAVAIGASAEQSFAHLPGGAMCSAKLPAKAELQCGKRAYFHGLGVVRSLRREVLRPRPMIRALLGERTQAVGRLGETLTDHLWLMKQGQRWMQEARLRITPPLPPDCIGASQAACSWYLDGATQCEVAHEGGFTSIGYVHGVATYGGRFQMDSSFETGTVLGREMQVQHGRAWNWPAWAQIEHAYEVWTARGWGPWPPYYNYGCSAYHGGTYIA